MFQILSRVYPGLHLILVTVRTINLTFPFYFIRCRHVLLAYLGYILFWVTIFTVEFTRRILTIPNFVLLDFVHCHAIIHCDFGPSDDWHSPWLQIIPYAVPSVIIVCALTLTIYKIQTSYISKGEFRAVTVTMVILTTIFLICTLTFSIFKHVIKVDSSTRSHAYLLRLMYVSKFTLAYTNSTLNPIIFIYRCQKIQESPRGAGPLRRMSSQLAKAKPTIVTLMASLPRRESEKPEPPKPILELITRVEELRIRKLSIESDSRSYDLAMSCGYKM